MSNDLPDVKDGVDYDSETETFRAAFDSSETEPSIAVVEILAQVKEKHPTELTQLYQVIDPEALNQFFSTAVSESPIRDRKIEFEFEDHIVTVVSCGIVKAQPSETADEILEE